MGVDVDQRAAGTQGHAGGIAGDAADGAEPAVVAVLHLEPVSGVVAGPAGAVGEAGAEGVEGLLGVLGVQAVGPGADDIGEAADVVGRETAEPAELRRPAPLRILVERVAVHHRRIPEADAGVQVEEAGALHGHGLVVDVDEGAAGAFGDAGRVALDAADGAEPAPRAVLHLETVGDVVADLAGAVREAGAEGLEGAGRVLRMQAVGPGADLVRKARDVVGREAAETAELVRPAPLALGVHGVAGVELGVPEADAAIAAENGPEFPDVVVLRLGLATEQAVEHDVPGAKVGAAVCAPGPSAIVDALADAHPANGAGEPPIAASPLGECCGRIGKFSAKNPGFCLFIRRNRRSGLPRP